VTAVIGKTSNLFDPLQRPFASGDDDKSVDSPRTYRHRPWLVLSIVVPVLLVAMAAPAVRTAIQNPGIDSVATAIVVLAPLSALAAFLLLGCRVHTTVDDDGITQHWILRHYRMEFTDLPAIEVDRAFRRWFLRVRRGEQTIEIIPCQTILWPGLSEALGPPRAMQACMADIERRWAAATTPGPTAPDHTERP
jgi:hypothetical protein